MTLSTVSAHVAVVSGMLTGSPQLDLQPFLHEVVTRARAAAHAGAAALVLRDAGTGPKGPTRVHLVVESSSSALFPRPEILLGFGRAAVEHDAVVALDDTAEPSRIFRSLAESAQVDGIRGIRATPIRVSGAAHGALVVCTPEPWLTPESESAGRDMLFLQALADLAGAGILLAGDRDRAATWATAINELASDTSTIEVAIGVLAERHGISIDAATHMLYDVARRRATTAVAIAQLIIDGAHVDRPGAQPDRQSTGD